MVAWVKEKEKRVQTPAEKREAEEADKVEVAPGVTVLASLRRFRAALIGRLRQGPDYASVSNLVWIDLWA